MRLGRDAQILGHLALEIVTLPRLLGRIGVARGQPFVEVGARPVPGLELAVHDRIGFQRPDHRLHGLDLTVFDRGDEAEGLALLELDPTRTGEQPVHGEGEGQPVRLDQAGQRLDAVLHVIGRAAGQQAPAGRCAEQILRMHGQDPAREMRGHHMGQIGVMPLGRDDDVRLAGSAVPFGGEGQGAQELPAGGVGHGQRQAAIGVAAGEGVHPVARLPPRHEVGRRRRHRIAFQFQGGPPGGIEGCLHP